MISAYHTFNDAFVVKIDSAYTNDILNQVKYSSSKVKLFQIFESLNINS